MAKRRIEETFYRGNLWEDAKKCDRKGCDDPRKCNHKEWIVGAFMNPGPRETELLEVKYWHYTRGQNFKHPLKTSCTLEFTLILDGKVKGQVNEEPVTLSAGGEYDYVVIPPGIPNALPEELLSECARGLTIKTPSIRCAKHEMKGRSFKVKTASGPNLGA